MIAESHRSSYGIKRRGGITGKSKTASPRKFEMESVATNREREKSEFFPIQYSFTIPLHPGVKGSYICMEIFLDSSSSPRETYPIFRGEEKRLERLILETESFVVGKLSRYIPSHPQIPACAFHSLSTFFFFFENLGNPPFVSSCLSPIPGIQLVEHNRARR